MYFSGALILLTKGDALNQKHCLANRQIWVGKSEFTTPMLRCSPRSCCRSRANILMSYVQNHRHLLINKYRQYTEMAKWKWKSLVTTPFAPYLMNPAAEPAEPDGSFFSCPSGHWHLDLLEKVVERAAQMVPLSKQSRQGKPLSEDDCRFN